MKTYSHCANIVIEISDPLRVPDRAATWCSPVRNLNILFSTLTDEMRLADLANVFRYAPNLEKFQISANNIYPEDYAPKPDIVVASNLKQVYFNGNNELLENYMQRFPNVELVIRTTNSVHFKI